MFQVWDFCEGYYVFRLILVELVAGLRSVELVAGLRLVAGFEILRL